MGCRGPRPDRRAGTAGRAASVTCAAQLSPAALASLAARVSPAALVSFALLVAVPSSAAAPAAPAAPPVVDRWPGVAAAYAVSINGRLLWGASLDEPRQPASLAKLLTALVLLDAGWDPDARVPVGRRAAGVEGTTIGLRAGEALRAADALTAMLVRSANDACVALVDHAGGESAVRPRLAARARALGLRASNFVDPCGFDAPGQRTTARDLLRLADAARVVPAIALRGRATGARIRTLGGRELRFAATNVLLGRMPEAVGLKTGYTRGAGRSLIALAERGPDRVVLVMLGAGEDRWFSASGLLHHALARAARLREAGSGD